MHIEKLGRKYRKVEGEITGQKRDIQTERTAKKEPNGKWRKERTKQSGGKKEPNRKWRKERTKQKVDERDNQTESRGKKEPSRKWRQEKTSSSSIIY